MYERGNTIEFPKEFFKRISGLIRNIINKNNINIQQIVHFVLIGQTCKSLKIKSLLLDIFLKKASFIFLLSLLSKCFINPKLLI